MTIIGETIFVRKFYCFLNGIDATIHPKVCSKKTWKIKNTFNTSVITLLSIHLPFKNHCLKKNIDIYSGRRLYQYNEDAFFKFWWLPFFQITSLQVNKEKLFKWTTFLCLYVFVYPCLIKIKIKTKVVFIVLVEIIIYWYIIAYHWYTIGLFVCWFVCVQ